MFHNPLFEEGMRVYFEESPRSRLFVVIPVLLTGVLLLAWPKFHFTRYLLTGSVPATYEILAFVSLGIVLSLSIRYGILGGASSPLYSYSEWLGFAGVKWPVFYAGRLAVAAAHTAALTAMTLPFLALGAVVAGISLASVGMTGALLFLIALAIRAVGIALLGLFERRKLALYITYWLVISALFVATPRSAPALNPIIALYALSGAGPGPSAAESLAWAGGFAVVAAALAPLALYWSYGRAKGGGR